MSASQLREQAPLTEECLLKAVNILADIVEAKGPAFRPLYHQVRQQLAEFRLQQQAGAALAAITAEVQSKVA